MLRVFLSSTFRDLKGERRLLLDNLNQALSDVGMENFIPDGRTSHEISIEELRKSDVVIFLISPYYGSLIEECKIKDCKADCPLKNHSGKISYTHCEYKLALAEDKPHQAYIVDADWDIIYKLKDKNQENWFEIFDNPKFKDRYSSNEFKHFLEIADNSLKFREEAELELCPRVTKIDRITSDLASNIVKCYYERKLDIMDFCGRRATLKELIEKMGESVEIYGVGGIGKTSLVQVGLLIQKLKGKRIVAIGTRQSYLTGSGYRHFKEKCTEERYEVIGSKVTLEDAAIALGIHKNLLGKDDPEKINMILDNINKRNICLFIDDFHLSDDNIKKLVNQANCSIVLASKRKIGLARSEIPLLGVEERDRLDLINLSAMRFHKELDSIAKAKIKDIAEGHPVSTEILVRNCEIINFRELENFKKSLNISNPKHSEELLRREVKEILSEEAFLLLRRLSLINPELESNIDVSVVRALLGNGSNLLINELLDTGMLSKKKEHDFAYVFSYKHIQDILQDDKKDHHKWALNYYLSKPSDFSEGYVDQIESLYHRSKIKPDEKLVSAYLDLSKQIMPGQYGFKRLIDVGEQLKSSFNKEEQFEALILGVIAVLYRKLNKFEEAKMANRTSLKLFRELYRKNRIIFKPHLANALNNIGILYGDLKKYDESEKAYLEALKISRELADRNQDAFRSGLANTLNNIAILYRTLNKYDESENAYQEALKIQRELANENPEAFKPNLAQTLNNIGNLYSDLNKYDESEKAYLEALKIRRELADRNPGAFKPDLAQTLNNIAILYNDLKKYDESENAYQKALKIERELASENPEAFKPDLAQTLNNIASTSGLI